MKPRTEPPASATQAVLYARVSSKEQEREGYSIPAQLELLREHAHRAGIVILQEFVDIESASTSGRSGFGKMIEFLRKNQFRCQAILVEKTDRLYRNFKDYVLLDECRLTIHFVKEGSILSPDSRSSEQLIHGIKVLMARNYSQNLGEETLKGMRQKAKTGLYPSFAPAGYSNAEVGGRRTIVPNDDARVISRLFDEFASGQYSLKSLAARARSAGWGIRGKRLHKSTLHLILRKRIYCGDFDWDGETYAGVHQPLVRRETWERVQAILDHRAENKQHPQKHDFAFTGFVRCGHCGCAFVGELKKQRYVYYHCTGHRGKCGEPYTREEALQEQLAAALRNLVMPAGVIAWLEATVTEADLNAQATNQREIKRMEEQHRRVQQKLDMIYEDRLEGRLSADAYDQKAKALHAESNELLHQINDARLHTPAPARQAIDLMSLISKAADLFLVQPSHEKQRFLRLVLKSASWSGGRLQTEFEEPFSFLMRSNQLTQTKDEVNQMTGNKTEIWLLG